MFQDADRHGAPVPRMLGDARVHELHRAAVSHVGGGPFPQPGPGMFPGESSKGCAVNRMDQKDASRGSGVFFRGTVDMTFEV